MAPYKMLAQKMKKKFYTFKIQHSQQNVNRYVDALVALGSQIGFERSSTIVEKENKRKEPIIEILKENFAEEEGCKKIGGPY